jgi:hypothetical protein
MFGLKEKRKEKQRRLKELQEEQRKEKEIQAKINIKRSLTSMKSQSAKLEQFKKSYIEKSRKAMKVGDQQTNNLAKSGLKICLSKQKVIDAMIANFEISMQLNDMNKIIGDFVGGMNIISEQMKNITSSIDMVKAQTAYEKAMANNEGQYQALDAFLETASDSIATFDGIDTSISDEEIDRLIFDEAKAEENSYDHDIDQKISNIKETLQS